MKRERFENVWDAIEQDPGVARNLKLRASLMLALKRHVECERMTQARAARLLGVSQPRVSNLMRGKIESFSLDLLVKMATAAGLRVSIRVQKAA